MRWPVQVVGAMLITIAGFAAVRTIAEGRNQEPAGGGAYPLDSRHGPAEAAWTRLLGSLRRLDQGDLASRLEELRGRGQVWVAPALDRSRRAIFVSTLRLVRRVYVAERFLTSRPAALYPELDVPPEYADAYATVALAGTLQHELTHEAGVEDEGETYDREIAWYDGLRATPWYAGLDPDEKEAWDFAIDLAQKAARTARERALDQ